MKEFILILYIFFAMGCASVGTHQEWKCGWVNTERYICKGAGCDVDFKNKTMKGGTFIPEIPLKVNN